jgi:hypothetical protein
VLLEVALVMVLLVGWLYSRLCFVGSFIVVLLQVPSEQIYPRYEWDGLRMCNIRRGVILRGSVLRAIALEPIS